MIGGDQQPVVAGFPQMFKERPDDVFVDSLQGFDFGVDFPFMGSFVGGFNMDDHEIDVSQRLDGVLSLGSVIGIEITRGAWHSDVFPTQQRSDSPQEIHGCDHRSLHAESFAEVL